MSSQAVTFGFLQRCTTFDASKYVNTKDLYIQRTFPKQTPFSVIFPFYRTLQDSLWVLLSQWKWVSSWLSENVLTSAQKQLMQNHKKKMFSCKVLRGIERTFREVSIGECFDLIDGINDEHIVYFKLALHLYLAELQFLCILFAKKILILLPNIAKLAALEFNGNISFSLGVFQTMQNVRRYVFKRI